MDSVILGRLLSGRGKTIARPTITISRPTMRAVAPANRSRRRPKRFLCPPLGAAGRRNAFAGAAERSGGRLTPLVGRRTSIGARRTDVVRPAERVGRVRTSVVSPEMSLVSCRATGGEHNFLPLRPRTRFQRGLHQHARLIGDATLVAHLEP
jgi:hypothetical protein